MPVSAGSLVFTPPRIAVVQPDAWDRIFGAYHALWSIRVAGTAYDRVEKRDWAELLERLRDRAIAEAARESKVAGNRWAD
jgi:hypothetical protein